MLVTFFFRFRILPYNSPIMHNCEMSHSRNGGLFGRMSSSPTEQGDHYDAPHGWHTLGIECKGVLSNGV